MLDAGRGDRLVGFAPHVEVRVLAGRRPEQVECEIGWQYPPDTVPARRGEQGELAGDHDVASPLDSRHDHVDALRGAVERSGVGKVGLHHLRAARDKIGERGVIRPPPARTDHQPELGVWFLRKVRGDAPTEHAASTGDQHRLRAHDAASSPSGASGFGPGTLSMP